MMFKLRNIFILSFIVLFSENFCATHEGQSLLSRLRTLKERQEKFVEHQTETVSQTHRVLLQHAREKRLALGKWQQVHAALEQSHSELKQVQQAIANKSMQLESSQKETEVAQETIQWQHKKLAQHDFVQRTIKLAHQRLLNEHSLDFTEPLDALMDKVEHLLKQADNTPAQDLMSENTITEIVSLLLPLGTKNDDAERFLQKGLLEARKEKEEVEKLLEAFQESSSVSSSKQKTSSSLASSPKSKSSMESGPSTLEDSIVNASKEKSSDETAPLNHSSSVPVAEQSHSKVSSSKSRSLSSDATSSSSNNSISFSEQARQIIAAGDKRCKEIEKDLLKSPNGNHCDENAEVVTGLSELNALQHSLTTPYKHSRTHAWLTEQNDLGTAEARSKARFAQIPSLDLEEEGSQTS
jgi:hypothetical protein